MTDANPTTDRSLKLLLVEPQPSYIESSGRWCWPLPKRACFPGCCTQVVTASREWWEYAPSEAKPHPFAEGVRLRDDKWYWAVPVSALSAEDIELALRGLYWDQVNYLTLNNLGGIDNHWMKAARKALGIES